MRQFARSLRGAGTTGLGSAFAIITLELAHAAGLDLGHTIAAAWVTLCIGVGNGFSRLGRGRIGQAVEDWLVRRLRHS